MSLHTLANHMAQTGRGPDSMLVHMSPREVNGLQALAKAHGGSLTINPETGLPEAGFLDSLLPMILGIALAPATGGASLGITEAWQTAALVGGVSALATGSLERGLMAGFGAYGGAGIGGSLAGAGVSQTAAEELVKQGTLTPADVGKNLAGSTAPNTSTFVPGADGMPANAMAGTPVGPPSTAMPFDPYSTGANPYALGNTAETAAYPGAAQAPGMVPPPGAASSAMSGIPDVYEPGANMVGNGANQMSPEAYANMAAKSMTPEQLAAAKAQMIEGIKNGTVSPFDSLGKGIQSLQDPGNLSKFAKSNMVPLGIAASQALLSQPKPTLRTPQAATGGFHTGYYDPVTHQYVNTGGYIPYADWGDKSVRDYTHAKDGGLMGLANGGAVAFDNGGFVVGGGGDGTAYGAFGSKEAYDKAVATETARRNAENAAQDAYQIPTDSPFYAASKGATGDQLNNLKNSSYEFQQRQENRAKLAAANPGGDGFVVSGPDNEGYNYGASKFGVTSKDYLPNVKNTSDVPAAGGAPTDRAKAQGIQTLVQPDTAAANAPAVNTPAATPSGVQQLMKDQHLVDPTTGHLVNPTLDAATLKMTRDGINTNAEMQQAYNGYWDTVKPGDILDFAGGTLTMNKDGTSTHTYTDAKGKQQSYTFNKGTDFATVARNDPNIAQEWKSMFNYVPASGTGTAGQATQTSTGWTPPVAPPTRVPTSMQDFNTRFNTMTPGGDSEANYNYLMGTGPNPKGTTNTEVAAPYWEKMGMAPVDKTRSSRIYDPNLKNAAGKVVGGYVANPDFKPKVMDPVTKRMVDVVTATDDERNKPTTTPDKGKEWTWSKDKKQWLQTDQEYTNAKGGMIGYATGGLGSLGGYSDGGQLLRGDGDGVSDSIPATIGNRQPARLADGEFVVPARIVSELGNGSTEAGARRLYQMMDRVQHARKKSIGKNNVATNSRAEQYLPA